MLANCSNVLPAGGLGPSARNSTNTPGSVGPHVGEHSQIVLYTRALPLVPFAKGAVDAWMGKIVKESGYRLTYEPNAFVYVKAPLTIKDFLAQKARVRAGYFFLPEAPRSMNSEIFYLPGEMLKVPIQRLPKFLFSGCIYAYSWIKGKSMAKSNKSLEEIWKTPESTKR